MTCWAIIWIWSSVSCRTSMIAALSRTASTISFISRAVFSFTPSRPAFSRLPLGVMALPFRAGVGGQFFLPFPTTLLCRLRLSFWWMPIEWSLSLVRQRVITGPSTAAMRYCELMYLFMRVCSPNQLPCSKHCTCEGTDTDVFPDWMKCRSPPCWFQRTISASGSKNLISRAWATVIASAFESSEKIGTFIICWATSSRLRSGGSACRFMVCRRPLRALSDATLVDAAGATAAPVAALLISSSAGRVPGIFGRSPNVSTGDMIRGLSLAPVEPVDSLVPARPFDMLLEALFFRIELGVKNPAVGSEKILRTAGCSPSSCFSSMLMTSTSSWNDGELAGSG
mmetsp:Transcript_88817/g.251789  ORF Transcript_88817/g.251789 Transcript_88817/m.251789 type:complete len:340 (+) Transcript_88817:1772-2791(+)